METWVLVMVVMLQGQPRAIETIGGYDKRGCDLAVYQMASSPPAAKLFTLVSFCVPGPTK